MSDIPNISDLHAEKNKKNKIKSDVFDVVLNKCNEKIKYTNSFTNHTYIFFEVPKILMGFPSYSMNSCIIFLKNKLTSSGYKVLFVEPFYLYIDWSSPVEPQRGPISNKVKLETEKLLKKFPGTSKVVYEYADYKKKK